ncbi:MAG TPA: helix-turn-helix domain-containing protein [Solirubrobacteraceae bacterium]|jgi:transcriptional regulator with XRE-family HTH domain|nr:helix-turn-helix domain-containing protein [Solirubrobacteraceae bacterium]
MCACDKNTAVPGAVQPIARNLRRWRTTREMTLSALAEQAGVAKSTVSLIERGQGNPSIDTVWALASALGVPFTSLFHDEPPADDVSVVHEGDGSVIAVDDAALKPDGLIVRHMLTRTGGALIEIYTLVLNEGAVRHAQARVAGLFEHITIAAGKVEISTNSFAEVLGQGDLISFRADRAHTYRVIDGPVRLVSVHEYPQRFDT